MSEYLVKSSLTKTEWQIISRIRKHELVCDDRQGDAGPNPVEYLCTAVNSCIVMSAGMVAKSHHLDVRNIHVQNQAISKDLGRDESVVANMRIKVFFDSSLDHDQQEKYLAHTLRVSTVYQTLLKAIQIKVELA